MPEEFIQFKCNICGASLNVSPEDIVFVCKYCGGLNPVSGIIRGEDFYIVPSVDEDTVINEFWRRVRGDLDLRKMEGRIRIKSIQGWYVPFWISRVEVDGVVIYTKEVYSGKRVRTIEKKEKFSETLDMYIVGRRQVRNIGVNELVKTYLRHGIKTVGVQDLDEKWWRSNKLSFLNVEFNREEAVTMIREEAVDILRRRWEETAHEIKFFKAEIKSMERPKLILLPLWEAIYEYEGSLYFAYHEGWRGSSLVFSEPMTVGRRALYLVGMVSSIVGGMLIGIIFSLTSHNDSDYIFALTSLLFLIAFLGHHFAKKFVSDVRIERSWR